MQDTFRHRGQRKRLIDRLRQTNEFDARVLTVMANLPRHVFLDSSFVDWAYRDEAFPIDCEQTISQPSTVAWQTTALQVLPRQKILEIGTGSGYQAAVLSLLGGRVFTVERHKLLYQKAKLTLKKLRLDRGIRFYLRDGARGVPEMAPFSRILVTAGAAQVPQALVDQLEVGGILVIPIGGEEEVQQLLRITKVAVGKTTEEELGSCRFVPFREGLA
ncbi:Protein-L-isoaspartate O-methyltransferase [Neolewinella maritima]|uniref:Protein-L-isoaspartate O-methyltransferase n=1 Tax=Neolewinella maritima TaxID=1383882 RepID=A0ABN8F786_9BACT|nr:protein-L-isoaspartate(D-aspartate) O-methyltransferase [Neolewinella maritima]CAH1000304.1 Protein-L-isoaspartate O-methyltransferase [Neolewinella maritima]